VLISRRRVFVNPKTNPKYQYSDAIYSSLALPEAPNHTLQLVETTLVTSTKVRPMWSSVTSSMLIAVSTCAAMGWYWMKGFGVG
jgi:hypothetical protein